MVQLIKNLDLSYLVDRLVNKSDWTPEKAKEAVRRYKNFLILAYKYWGKGLSPAPDIDEVWHAHILHTREYMRDCEAIFGTYLHHAPFRDTGKPKDGRGFNKISKLYAKEFKEPYLLDLDISSFW